MNNLASLILEGSNYVNGRADMGDYDYSDSIIAESSFIDSAVATLFTDIMEADKSYMVADVIAAATIIREQSMGNSVDVTAITEGVNGGIIAKLKAAFQKFWAKIKEYYHKVKDWFKAMFLSAGKFVNTFGDMLKKKTVKGFSYEGYKYTYDKGSSAVDGVLKKTEDKIKTTIGEFDYINNNVVSTDDFKEHLIKSGVLVAGNKEGYDKVSASDAIDNFLSKELKYDDISEMKKELEEKFHDDSSSKGTITDFEANSVDSMINWIKDSTKLINNLDKELRNYENNINKVIKKLDNIKDDEIKDADGKVTGKGNESSQASYISSLVSGYFNAYKAACETRIGVAKEMITSYHGTLKKFYNYKPAKESYAPYDAEAYATLENYIILEGKDDDDAEEDTDSKKKSSDDEEDVATESAISSILEQASRFTF